LQCSAYPTHESCLPAIARGQTEIIRLARSQSERKDDKHAREPASLTRMADFTVGVEVVKPGAAYKRVDCAVYPVHEAEKRIEEGESLLSGRKEAAESVYDIDGGAWEEEFVRVQTVVALESDTFALVGEETVDLTGQEAS
jgi:hypothetical protein